MSLFGRMWQHTLLTGAAIVLVSGSAIAQQSGNAAAPELPRTLVWTAYDLGASGYNQAVAIGNVLKNELGVNLRVLPGKNDVSRLVPLRESKAEYSATGSDATYASEGMYLFAGKEWGPQPVSQILMNVSHGGSTMGVAADTGITRMEDLRGKRVAFVKSAASLQNSTRGMLAFGGLTWDDVVKVEVPGYAASVQAVVDGQADALYVTTQSAPILQIEASPRGLYLMSLPFEDEEGWARLREVLPFFFPTVATLGPTLSEENGKEMPATAYPVLITYPAVPQDQNYNMAKAMHVYFEQYKGNAPGIDGWAMNRQRFANTLIPFSPGAIRYLKEIGTWTDAAQETHDGNLTRQALLKETWEAYQADAPSDDIDFQQGWMKTRAAALNEAGLPVIQEEWSVE